MRGVWPAHLALGSGAGWLRRALFIGVCGTRVGITGPLAAVNVFRVTGFIRSALSGGWLSML